MVLCPVISGNAVALRAVQAAFAGVSGQLVEDVACGVEGEFLFGVPAGVGRFENPAQLVVGVMGGAASEVGAADEVAGFVVAVAAFDEGAGTGGALALGALASEPAHGVVVEPADECALGPLGFAVQPVAFDVGDGLAVEGDMVQMAAAVIKGADLLAVGQCGLEAVAVGVVLVGDAGLAAVVGEGFAGDPAEGVVGVFEAAVAVAGADEAVAAHIAGGVVVETGADSAVVFVPGTVFFNFAAGFFDELTQQVAGEVVDVPDFGQDGAAGVLSVAPVGVFQAAVFGLLRQLSCGIVGVGGDFAVPAGFADEAVGVVVVEQVVFAVFVGEPGEAAGGVVGVGEAVAQGVGALFGQAVFVEGVAGLAAQGVGMAGQAVQCVVAEMFAAAVGMVGADVVAVFVIMITGGLIQRVGNGFDLA